MKRRVVVTGLGIVSALGNDISQFWQNCLEAKTSVEAIPEYWQEVSACRSQHWSACPQPDYTTFEISRVEQLQNDPCTLFALCAAKQALNSAGLNFRLAKPKERTFSIDGLNTDRSGVYFGTGIGGYSTISKYHAYHASKKLAAEIDTILQDDLSDKQEVQAKLRDIRERMQIQTRFNPYVVSMIMPNAPASILSIKFGLHGPARTSCSACAAGTVSIGQARNAISSGEVDLALTGGTEYLYDKWGDIFHGFDVIDALAKGEADEINRPFDRNRNGFLLSQGGASVLILEELEHAEKRGAKILAEVIGYGETSDSSNVMMMDKSGQQIISMINQTLADAEISAAEVDYINTHGTGTALNDDVEAEVIEKIFGNKVLVNSTKSLLGHTLGASGAIEATVAVLSLMHQTTHISRNLEAPIRDLKFVTDVKPREIKTALSQSFAFGGHNAALLFRCWDE
ncbi:MAG: beta-ketoacyl-[acyl-carrier-protein] synthase family protein [Bdellovibrionota bacterium]